MGCRVPSTRPSVEVITAGARRVPSVTRYRIWNRHNEGFHNRQKQNKPVLKRLRRGPLLRLPPRSTIDDIIRGGGHRRHTQVLLDRRGGLHVAPAAFHPLEQNARRRAAEAHKRARGTRRARGAVVGMVRRGESRQGDTPWMREMLCRSLRDKARPSCRLASRRRRVMR